MYGAYIGGIFPRSERLIEATRQRAPNLPALFREEKSKIINLQVDAGLSYVADPMEDWDDMLRPFLKIKGLEEGALTRFYENNTFYRKPIVVENVRGSGDIASNALSLDLLPKKSRWKATLPDPYTFADLCEDHCYDDKIELMFDLAKVLSKEAASLVSAGARLIQLNGPSIVSQQDPEILTRIGEAVEKVSKGLGAETYLHLYFKNCSKVAPRISEFKVDGIGIDFRNTPIVDLEGLDFKGLACGCIDAMNTRIETPREVASFAEQVLRTLEPKKIYLTTNCDLEFVPYAFAKQKVRNLGETLRLLGGD